MTLSAAHTAKGKLQRALLELLRVHERDGTLPTSARFLFYELVQAGVVSKTRKGARRVDTDTGAALTHLRNAGLVPWEWIEDETRTLDQWRYAPSVAEYVSETVARATVDRWGGQPAPLILCESRSLAGALRNVAAAYCCAIVSTNGQARGFLITKVAPALQADQRVLYLGDWDYCGLDIEKNTRRTLVDAIGADLMWERVALTSDQVRDLSLPVIAKPDARFKDKRAFEAVETEALGQARIVALLRDRLDELMPEPIARVLEREQRQRDEVTEQLRRLTNP